MCEPGSSSISTGRRRRDRSTSNRLLNLHDFLDGAPNYMIHDDIAPCDALRTAERALAADDRMGSFVAIREDGMRRISLADRHAEISTFELVRTAPLDVRIHFENAKNLYLYAWFVYRFHVVAEEHAIGSLEYALRLRLVDGGFVSAAKGKSMGLANLLERAKTRELIRNEDIKSRVKWATDMAKRRYSFLQIEAMNRDGLTEMAFDDSHVVPTDADLAYDWILQFIESLPGIRNDYAHGSSTLRPTVLRTFDIVCDFINQLFAAPPHAEGVVNEIR